MTDTEKTTEPTFSDLPRKALLKIFACLLPEERQKLRRVGKFWNDFINLEYPLAITITNDNFELMSKCVNAQKVTTNNLTIEFSGPIAFKNTLTSLEISGKVVSSNVLRIMRSCQQLESITFNALKQVLSIENSEIFAVPKLKKLEIKVRSDQETFTSDELILLNTLRKIRFPLLENILISVRSYLLWEDDDDDDDLPDMDEESGRFTVMGTSSIGVSAETSRSRPNQQRQIFPSEAFDRVNVETDVRNRAETPAIPHLANEFQSIGGMIVVTEDSSAVDNVSVQSDDNRSQRPLFVDVSSGSTATNASRESTYSTVGVAEYEFAARISNRLSSQARNMTDFDAFLNDPGVSNQMNFFRSTNAYNPYANSNATTLTTTIFFEIMKNNAEKLKKFVVEAKPDFVCFGNIGSFPREVISRIQLEEIEYSFGRSNKLCLEYLLLEEQTKLKSLKIHLLDDMLTSVMTAAGKSHSTLVELDMKILSLSEEAIDLTTLARCHSLQILKLFHFYEKEGLRILPTTLVKFFINGPVSRDVMKSFTIRLENLEEFTLILNTVISEKIDITLFKQMVFMPKIKRLTFIQSQIDVEAVSTYCERATGLKLRLTGPRSLREPFTLTNSIQLVSVIVNNPQAPTDSKFVLSSN